MVIGTAGHIDHGKTALVRALTGIDTDRLEEEKRRGISIDLGFAHLQLAEDLRIAFIDVPGHEKFIKNMLAGVGGIDAVLFVVSADESIKPQTREHFEICRLLRIERGVIALTKADLVDEEILGLVRLEVEELVSDSFLQSAAIVPVSTVTGEGLDELRSKLAALSRETVARNNARPFRMPVDRSFIMQGFGAVVTGTIISGRVDIDSELELHPGKDRVRVRGIQVHGKSSRSAAAGQRAAVNLAGIDHADVTRGMTLAAPGRFLRTLRADCMLELLPSAHPLKDRAPVHFHSGTAETIGEVRLLAGSGVMQPGSTAPVRIIFREPVLLVQSDRFIVRMFSPVITIGGGEVVDAHGPARYRRNAGAARIEALAKASLAEYIATVVREAPYGMTLDELVIRTGASAAECEGAMPESVVRLGTIFVDAHWAQDIVRRWKEQLRAFHREQPLQPGLKREELRSREFSGASPALFDALLSTEPAIVASGELLHLATHTLALKQDEEQALAGIERAFETAGLSAPGTAEVLSRSGVDPARARSLLQILLRQRRLIRVTDEMIFHPAALKRVREILASRKGGRFSVPEFKDWTGISRKYAIPLLEYLDRERVTRREGDVRLIL